MGFQTFFNSISFRSRKLQGNKIRATVVDNVDPDGEHGRIKIRRRDLDDGIADEDLAWSLPHEGYGSGAGGSGKKDIPAKGSIVFVDHQDESLYHPVYYHGPSTTDRDIKELGPDKPGHVDRGGNLSMVDHSNGQNIKTDTHQSGTGTTVNTDGSVIQNMVKGLTQKVFGSDGESLMQFEGKLKIYAKEIEFLAKNPIKMSETILGGPPPDIGDKPKERDKPQFPNTGGQEKY